MPRRRSRPAGDVAEKVRAALRSIIRDWNSLHAPLPVDEISTPIPNGAQRFRVRGAQSYEELQEQILEFAGRVWQFKDGLIKWLEAQPDLQLGFSDANTDSTVVGTGGKNARQTVEELAKICPPLLLCADLYNSYKHYTDCDRSGYQPYLSGVQFDTSTAGICGIQHDGSRKMGDVTVANPSPVPIRVSILSRNQSVDFGDAVVNIARAFRHWFPVVRQMNLLSASNVGDRAILNDLDSIEEAVDRLDPFKPTSRQSEAGPG